MSKLSRGGNCFPNNVGSDARICTVVPPLSPRDRILLEATAGWLMLGNPAEAMREFAQVSAEGRARAEGLVMLWEIHAQAKEWAEAVEAADRVIEQMRDKPDGYIKRAYALHELKRSQEAWDTLEPVSALFNDNWLIPYNLACYAAQLGREQDAVKWYRRALRVGDERELQEMALSDPDLQPIRPKIEKMAKG